MFDIPIEQMYIAYDFRQLTRFSIKVIRNMVSSNLLNHIINVMIASC